MWLNSQGHQPFPPLPPWENLLVGFDPVPQAPEFTPWPHVDYRHFNAPWEAGIRRDHSQSHRVRSLSARAEVWFHEAWADVSISSPPSKIEVTTYDKEGTRYVSVKVPRRNSRVGHWIDQPETSNLRPRECRRAMQSVSELQISPSVGGIFEVGFPRQLLWFLVTFQFAFMGCGMWCYAVWTG